MAADLVAPETPPTERLRLDELELRAWTAFLKSHAAVVRRLENDLMAAHRMPLAVYDVLVQLVQAPQHRLRMTELADRIMLSRSGLTRLVDRLEREGLVRREACASDARGLNAVLTEAGYARLRAAAPTHLRGIRQYVLSHLSREEIDLLAGLLGKVLQPAEPEEDAAVRGQAAEQAGPAHSGGERPHVLPPARRPGP